jgi:serine/threonine protein phosphatase PrpC
MSSPMSETVVLHGLGFDVAAFSEQGPRTENQDAFSIERFRETGLVAVADGMGGERGGRYAADTALAAVLGAAPIRSLDDARRAARAADLAVVRAAEADPAAHGGMGCALALLSLVQTRGDGPGWVGAHVGDVRILSRSPDGTVRLETRDHTPAYARWEAGEVELDEVPETPGANRLQRAVGRGGEADAVWLPARAGWAYLLISDGVTKAMRIDELGAAMAAPTAAAACELIRRKVAERGPDDNYTAVVVRIEGSAPAHDDTATHEMMNRSPLSTAAPERRGWHITLLVLALLAIAGAAFAYWTALDARSQASAAVVEKARVDSLRVQLDSLQARIQRTNEPFAPGTSSPAAPGATASPPHSAPATPARQP